MKKTILARVLLHFSTEIPIDLLEGRLNEFHNNTLFIFLTTILYVLKTNFKAIRKGTEITETFYLTLQKFNNKLRVLQDALLELL